FWFFNQLRLELFVRWLRIRCNYLHHGCRLRVHRCGTVLALLRSPNVRLADGYCHAGVLRSQRDTWLSAECVALVALLVATPVRHSSLLSIYVRTVSSSESVWMTLLTAMSMGASSPLLLPYRVPWRYRSRSPCSISQAPPQMTDACQGWWIVMR